MERLIFEYNNGERQVFGDPLLLRDRIFTVSMGEFWNLRKKVLKIDAANDDITIIMEGIEARGHLVNIARAVFDMVPYNDATGKGATAEDCLNVTNLFLHWLDQKKTNAARQQTTLPPSASTVPPPTPANTATM